MSISFGGYLSWKLDFCSAGDDSVRVSLTWSLHPMACMLGGWPRPGAAIPLPALAAERVVVLDPSASEVTFTLETTFDEVDGKMGADGGHDPLRPRPGEASGDSPSMRRRPTPATRARRDDAAEVLESALLSRHPLPGERVEGVARGPGSQRAADRRRAEPARRRPSDHDAATVETDAGRAARRVRLSIASFDWGLQRPSSSWRARARWSTSGSGPRGGSTDDRGSRRLIAVVYGLVAHGIFVVGMGGMILNLHQGTR